MGMRTELEVSSWQQKAGIEPARGERVGILVELQKAAFEAIKIIELERSGIRDGDGYWHGADVVGHMCAELVGLCTNLMAPNEKDWWYAEQAKWEKVNSCGRGSDV